MWEEPCSRGVGDGHAHGRSRRSGQGLDRDARQTERVPEPRRS
jgi:hypothetical protein